MPAILRGYLSVTCDVFGVLPIGGQTVKIVLQVVDLLMDLVDVGAVLATPTNVPIGGFVDRQVAMAIAYPRQHGSLRKRRVALMWIVEVDRGAAKQLITARTHHRIERRQLARLAQDA